MAEGPRESLIQYDAPLELGPATEKQPDPSSIQAQMQQKLAQVITFHTFTTFFE